MKVLVITPTYGRLPLLGRLLASFLSQTYRDKELVIVNDDKNITLVCNYPDVTCINMNKKILIGQKKNLATNIGYHDLYMPHDDDDIFLPERISNHVRLHLSRPDINMYRNTKSYITYGDDFMVDNSTLNAISYTRKGWFESLGYTHPTNCGEDGQFLDSMPFLYQTANLDELDYVYNFGGMNYHLSSTPDNTIERIAIKQLKELNITNGIFTIIPDFEEHNKFIELDKRFKQLNKPNARINIKHISLGKIQI